MLSSTQRHRYARRETLFHDGDLADTIHFISEGRVAVHRSTPAGHVAMFAVLGPGEAFGEMAMLAADRRRTSAAVALEPVITHTLRFVEFDDLCRAHPHVQRLLVDLLSQRVARLSTHLLEALYVPADQRVVRRLLDLCGEYDDGAAAHDVTIPLTQDEIAELSGASRPTTNRVLRALARDGVVSLHRGHVEVLNWAALLRRSPVPTVVG
ncbi:Crp/Fnr family transcriptional regulator [Lapillicoccus sp.]|uniref:Crp/Fnr family transcriptional regulator n=1 Tax=Lapillicoccus sp. TaxID=1909287 RepID=UPI0039838F5A